MTIPIIIEPQTLIRKASLFVSVSATLYDYLLVFDDEIQYVWKGRKSLIFYLYILNRILLVAYQFWSVCYFIILTPQVIYIDKFNARPHVSLPFVLVGVYTQALSAALFVLSSDIFVTLRTYAISRSKALVFYFIILALGRLATFFMGTFAPEIGSRIYFIYESRIAVASVSIGTAFEVSAIIVVVWCTYRNKSALKYSALVRTIVTQATVYFLVIVAAQIYLQLSFGLQLDGFFRFSPTNAYAVVSPILTLRFVLSLKKSADPEGGQMWQLKHFTTLDFASVPPGDTQGSTTRDDTEMDPMGASHRRISSYEP